MSDIDGQGHDEGSTHAEGEVFDPAPYRPTRRGFAWLGGLGAAVLAGLLVFGIVPRVLHDNAMADEEHAAAAATPTLLVARAEKSATGSKLVLPGSVQPLQETAIYARANGYVRRWLVDIGGHVTRGQTLVELDLPDIDDELRQAQAAALQAKANIEQVKTQLQLAKTTNGRYSFLGQAGLVSKQDVDTYQASLDVQQAALAAAQAGYGSAEANTRHLQDLKSFGTVAAPFDGVVTARTAEVGQLVSAGGSGAPLFKVAEVDVVRVFVNVPQLYASVVGPGVEAPTTVREMPHRTFAGKVARTANELDVASRSQLTEVDIPNPDGALIAGMYATVTFDVKLADPPVLVPATAALFDAHGTRVAVVKDGVVQWRTVVVAADLGDRLAVASGLAEGETVASSPSDHLVDGMHVVPQLAGAKKP